MEQFTVWCEQQDVHLDTVRLNQCLLQLQQCCDFRSYESLKDCHGFVQLHDLFVDFSRSISSPLVKFWLSYIDMVLLLLRFIRAKRQGLWELHKASVQNMQPWFFFCMTTLTSLAMEQCIGQRWWHSATHTLMLKQHLQLVNFLSNVVTSPLLK